MFGINKINNKYINSLFLASVITLICIKTQPALKKLTNNLAARENGFNPKRRHVAFHRGLCHAQNNCFLRPIKCTTYQTGSSSLFSHEFYPEQSVHEINRAPSSHHAHHHRHRDHLHHRRRVRFTEHRTDRVKGMRCPETHIRRAKHAHKTTNTTD